MRGVQVSAEEGGMEARQVLAWPDVRSGNPTGHPGWLSRGASTAEWLLEGKTEGLWVAGRVSGGSSQSRGARW